MTQRSTRPRDIALGMARRLVDVIVPSADGHDQESPRPRLRQLGRRAQGAVGGAAHLTAEVVSAVAAVARDQAAAAARTGAERVSERTGIDLTEQVERFVPAPDAGPAAPAEPAAPVAEAATETDDAPAPSVEGRARPGVPYEERTKAELYERARELDIPGRSQMTKDELVAALRDAT